MLGLGIVASVIVGYAWRRHAAGHGEPTFRTEPVERGDLIVTVSATGTIEPEDVVDVGAQVVGMIKEFGVDPADSGKPIDFLSAVEKGTVLARIDDALYRARADRAAALVDQARAQQAKSKTDTLRAEANVLQTRAKFKQSERDWGRAQKLRPTQAISDADYDQSQAAFEVAGANLKVSQAAVEQARAEERLADKALVVAEADLSEAQQNLDYTVIRSPVRGVIVDRRVNVGQTVVSNLNAPSLFLIAKDLGRLEVWASVNEADVGRLQRGQPVRFTVDAFPDEPFTGEVTQIRLNATMTQNVVTYTVIVKTENTAKKLIPYLTASMQFEVGRRSGVLLVPNSALRWQPSPEQIAPEVRSRFAASLSAEKSTDANELAPDDQPKSHDRAWVWFEEGHFARPLEVKLGLSDGLRTEILEGAIEGRNVIVGAVDATADVSTSSPFTPQMFGGGRR